MSILSPDTRSVESEPDIIGGPMIASYGASDPGCVRTNNEDYFLVDPDLGLYLVADGMGGAQAGEHASKLAAETVREMIRKAAETSNGNREPRVLIEAFEEANRRVMDTASRDPNMEGMGTTLVAALESKDGLQVANVGDSRLYLFENGRLHSITEDQTWVNEVGRRLGLDEESLKTHPMRHVLTMAIGVSEQLRVHTYTLKPASGMQVLLCSDGLHGVARETDVAEILGSKKTLEAKCGRLIEVARAQGGPDNITAVILESS
jgi:PPM family protein phosphatase